MHRQSASRPGLPAPCPNLLHQLHLAERRSRALWRCMHFGGPPPCQGGDDQPEREGGTTSAPELLQIRLHQLIALIRAAPLPAVFLGG